MSEVDVVSMRPFVPASDFEKSSRFYAELGFAVSPISPAIALVSVGRFDFLLQAYDSEEFARQYMMQIMVNDLNAWWRRITELKLAETYGVPAPTAPAVQPWGLTVAFVVDPSDVLWHFVQKPR